MGKVLLEAVAGLFEAATLNAPHPGPGYMPLQRVGRTEGKK